MVKRAFLVGVFTLTMLSGSAFGGVTYTETADVGALPGSAADLTDITVDLLTGYAGAGDVDMFKICITDPTDFSACSYNSALDTQLQLFDASGLGVYANDDISGEIGPSLLPANDPLGPTSAGLYYLGVSQWSADPLSAGGEIFSGSWDDVMGPAGPGGASPVIGWEPGGGNVEQDYQITLTGVGQCPGDMPTVPAPGSALLCGLGLAVMRSVRRRRTNAA